jgi:hypothetical protein
MRTRVSSTPGVTSTRGPSDRAPVMTRTELSDLDRHLARGPHLVNGAILGAGVGAVIGWLSGRSVSSSVAQGAVGGVCVGLLVYGYAEWSSSRAHAAVPELEGRQNLVGALAPFPFYAPSVTYPWSAH